ncbi:hypothetical protein [Streptomyces sp. NPDC058466]|uniref:hypothetical protein n=1 Tax=Streptomyces sp. NPDC058466 TaxID=3346512 RepID=UPI00365712B8
MSDYNIPPDVEAAVVTQLYAQAAELDWTHLNSTDRTRWYQSWTKDPEIGGRLIGFVGGTENIRPWLKDCPMKEYERARRGEGKYSAFITRHAATLEEVVAKTMGADWEIVEGTRAVKPLRVRIRRTGSEDDERHFVLGEEPQLKHLLWPAVIDRSRGESYPWVVCVVDPFAAPLTVEQKSLHRRLENFLGVRVVYFSEI